jgi:cold shock CspA family protein
MIGQFIGRIIGRHDRGFGWVTDDTPGSPNRGYAIFYHMKSINGGRHIGTCQKITFDVVPDPKHPGKVMAVNIDPMDISSAKPAPTTDTTVVR